MIGKKIICFDTINSTNQYVKDHHKDLESGTVIVAKKQTSGYGRLHRKWESSEQDNLTFSLLLKLPFTERISLLTQVAAASVYRSLKDLKIDALVKWPNDILVQDKKICGILVETILEKKYVNVTIGFGLNVNALNFKNDLSDKATSMSLESGKSYIVKDILHLLLKNVNIYLKDFLEESDIFLDLIRDNSYLIGKYVYLSEEESQLVLVKNIDHLGRLVVVSNNKEVAYTGSEVTLTSNYGNKEKNYG